MAARNIRMIAGNGNHVVEIAPEEAVKLAKAMSETSYALGAAGAAFAFLHDQHASGYLNNPDTQAGMAAVLELCGRGMNALTDEEGRLVEDFAYKLERLTKEAGNVDQ